MKNIFRVLFNIIIFAILTATNLNAFASQTATFLVSAQILPACTITAAPLNFLTYTSTADSKVNTTLTVICTPGTTYKVGLNKGVNGTATNARKMVGTTSSSNVLNYGLYLDAAYANNWDATAPNWATGTAALSGIPPLTVYGKIPAGQNSAVDNYTDTVTATVTFP